MKKKQIFTLLLLALAGAAAAQTPQIPPEILGLAGEPASPTGALCVRVHYAKDQKPLAGAQFVLAQMGDGADKADLWAPLFDAPLLTATTDSAGQFHLGALPTGRYLMRLIGNAWEFDTVGILVEDRKLTSLDLTRPIIWSAGERPDTLPTPEPMASLADPELLGAQARAFFDELNRLICDAGLLYTTWRDTVPPHVEAYREVAERYYKARNACYTKREKQVISDAQFFAAISLAADGDEGWDESPDYSDLLSQKTKRKLEKVDRQMLPELHFVAQKMCVMDATPAFARLDSLCLADGVLVGIRPAMAQGMGDASQLFFYDQKDLGKFNPMEEGALCRPLNAGDFLAAPSAEAAWQTVALAYVHSQMPLFWHGGYERKQFILSPSDLDSLRNYHDNPAIDIPLPRDPAKLRSLLPQVEASGMDFVVRYTYWTDWGGLVSETALIEFLGNRLSGIELVGRSVLYEYQCGVRF